LSPTQILDVIRRKRKLIALCALAGVLLALLAYFTIPKRYTATGLLEDHPGEASKYRIDPAAILGGSDSSIQMETDTNVLSSNSVFLSAADEIRLVKDPVFWGRKTLDPEESYNPNDPAVQEKLLRTMHKDIGIARIPKTQLIRISATTLSPTLSAHLVDTLMDSYITTIFQTRFASTQHAAKWLSTQLADLKDQVEKSQESLIDLQRKLGIVGLDQKDNTIVSSIETMTKAADEAKVQRIIAEGRYRILSEADSNLIEGGPGLLTDQTSNLPGTGTVLTALRGQHAQLATQYAQLTAEFGPNYPDVVRVKSQLEETTKAEHAETQRLVAQSRVAYTAAVQSEALTQGALDQRKAEAFQMRDDMVRFAILQHDYESNRALYEGLLARLREAGVVSGLEASEIDIIDNALIPTKPAGLSLAQEVFVGFILGLIFGLTASYLIENFVAGVRNAEEIELITGLPSLAVLPVVKTRTKPASTAADTGTTGIYVLDSPRSPYAEAIRALRSAISFSGAGHFPKRIMFTSCLPSEGKSTTSRNLACARAMMNQRVLLVDTDMRKPTLSKALKVSNEIGLSNVLSGSASISSAILPVPSVPNLFIVPSGPTPPNPSELLASDRMRLFISDVEADFDTIIFDTPPSLLISDSAEIAHLMDAVILVVRYGLPNRQMLRRTRDNLMRGQAPLKGFVLNQMEVHNLSSYYYYGDSYAYGDGKVS
jgi:capsular exopolysaccharide synthesis family protein